MALEVDQSGRIERLDQDTVIAVSNNEQYCIKISKKLKREIYSAHRKKIKQIRYKLFCIGVYYCIKKYLRKGYLIIIDNEYHGKNNLIKSILVSYINKEFGDFNTDFLRFNNIGKKLNAHHVAIETFREEHRPNETLTEEQIWRLIK